MEWCSAFSSLSYCHMKFCFSWTWESPRDARILGGLGFCVYLHRTPLLLCILLPTSPTHLALMINFENDLTSKSKVQTITSLILSRISVLNLLLHRHRAPYLLTWSINSRVVELDEWVSDDVPAADANEDFISSAVEGRVVLSVDICGDDGGHLRGHVVHGSWDGSSTHSVGVSAVPGNLHCVGYIILVYGRHVKMWDSLRYGYTRRVVIMA